MYFFARQWRILSKCACFSMEGSHRRLKRMLCNSGGLSLLRGRLGLQLVVDNHTIDDSLRRERWDLTKRSMRGQQPQSVRLLAARARRKALSDLGYVKTCSSDSGPARGSVDTETVSRNGTSFFTYLVVVCLVMWEFTECSVHFVRNSREFCTKFAHN